MNLFQNQPQQHQQNGSNFTVITAITNVIRPVVQELCRQNALNTNIAADLENLVYQNREAIANQLIQNYGNTIPGNGVQQMVADVAANLLRESGVQSGIGLGGGIGGGIGNQSTGLGLGLGLQNQSSGLSIGRNNPTYAGGGLGNRGGGLGLSGGINTDLGSTKTQEPIMVEPTTPVAATEEVVAPAAKKPTKVEVGSIVASLNPLQSYEAVDIPNIGRYSKTFNDLPMLSVSAGKKYRCIQDNEVMRFTRLENHIREISVDAAINNIIDTNPLIFSDKWISSMSFESISVLRFGSDHTDIINIDILYDPESELSHEHRINEVIAQLSSKPHNFVKAIERLLMPVFNRLLKATVRLSDNTQFFQVPDLNSISELLSMESSDSEVSALLTHPNFTKTVLNAFRRSIGTIITDTCKTGYHPIKDSIFDMKASPDFIIRDKGICEKDPELDMNEEAMKYIEKNFTVIGQHHHVVVSNFIPTDLYDDLNVASIKIDEVRSIVDELVINNQVGECPVFLCKESNDLFVTFIVGRTMDGIPFMEKVEL